MRPAGQEIACHFSQDHTVVTKLLDFIHKNLNLKVVTLFFHYLDRFFRNLAKTDTNLGIFGIENHKIDFFSIFLLQNPLILFQIWMKIFMRLLFFCKTKINDFRIFASDFFHFDLCLFQNPLRPNYGLHWSHWSLKF